MNTCFKVIFIGVVKVWVRWKYRIVFKNLVLISSKSAFLPFFSLLFMKPWILSICSKPILSFFGRFKCTGNLLSSSPSLLFYPSQHLYLKREGKIVISGKKWSQNPMYWSFETAQVSANTNGRPLTYRNKTISLLSVPHSLLFLNYRWAKFQLSLLFWALFIDSGTLLESKNQGFWENLW